MKKGKETGELGQASTLAWLFFVSVLFLLQLALGIVSCSCQLHCENKETFRLAIEKSVGCEGLDGGYRTA